MTWQQRFQRRIPEAASQDRYDHLQRLLRGVTEAYVEAEGLERGVPSTPDLSERYDHIVKVLSVAIQLHEATYCYDSPVRPEYIISKLSRALAPYGLCVHKKRSRATAA